MADSNTTSHIVPTVYQSKFSLENPSLLRSYAGVLERMCEEVVEKAFTAQRLQDCISAKLSHRQKFKLGQMAEQLRAFMFNDLKKKMRLPLEEMMDILKRQDYLIFREECMHLKEGQEDDPFDEEDEFLDQVDRKLDKMLQEAEEKKRRREKKSSQ